MLKFMQIYIRVMHIVINSGIGVFILICCRNIITEGIEQWSMTTLAMAIGILAFGEVIFRCLNKSIFEISITDRGVELTRLCGNKIFLDPVDIKSIRQRFLMYEISVGEKTEQETYKCVLNVNVVKYEECHKGIKQDDFKYIDIE